LTETNKKYFNFLKEKISETFLEEHHGPKHISEWKGETIVIFQEDLFGKTNGRISEKSFYTYFKNEPKKLPRIDMLNLLSSYVGYESWNEFTTAHSGFISEEESNIKSKKRKGLMPALWIAILLPILIIFFITNQNDNEFSFCLFDEDTNTAITTIPIDVKILQENESPIYIKTDSTGCFSYETSNDRIRFVVQSPYHKTDTIVRDIKSNENKTVKLATDDYALMLKYYSDGNLADVNKRKKQLETLISNDAQIFQVLPNVTGIEMYSKVDFINKVTTPTQSLKRLQVLDKEYKNGKIIKLKFRIQ